MLRLHYSVILSTCSNKLNRPVRKTTSLFPKHFLASINISSCPKNYIFFIFTITVCASSMHIMSAYLFPPLPSFPSRFRHSSVLVTLFRPTQYFIALYLSGSLYIVDHPRLIILLALSLCLHNGSLPSRPTLFLNIHKIYYRLYIYSTSGQLSHPSLPDGKPLGTPLCYQHISLDPISV